MITVSLKFLFVSVYYTTLSANICRLEQIQINPLSVKGTLKTLTFYSG